MSLSYILRWAGLNLEWCHQLHKYRASKEFLPNFSRHTVVTHISVISRTTPTGCMDLGFAWKGSSETPSHPVIGLAHADVEGSASTKGYEVGHSFFDDVESF